MFSGGASLEAIASRRARRELTALVQRAPKVAQLRVDDAPRRRCRSSRCRRETWCSCAPARSFRSTARSLSGGGGPRHEHPQRRAAAGDARRGDAGAQRHGQRRRPVRRARGSPRGRERLRGAGPPRRAGAGAARAAGADGRPLRRVLPAATLLVAAAAWAISGDPVRALAVVVVATPCPLILAAPIALVSGLSRAARAGVIVKGAGRDRNARRGAHGAVRQDRHAHCRHARGAGDRDPRTASIRRASCCGWPPRSTGCPRTCSVRRLVGAADEAGLELTMPDGVREEPGQGIEGTVDGRRVAVGSRRSCAPRRARRGGRPSRFDAATRGSGEAHVLVALDGHIAGVIVMADELRPDAAHDRPAAARRGRAPRRDGLRRPPLGGRARRSRARRRPRVRRAVARGQARGRAAACAPTRSCVRW